VRMEGEWNWVSAMSNGAPCISSVKPSALLTLCSLISDTSQILYYSKF
jgi:hypothetical protein